MGHRPEILDPAARLLADWPLAAWDGAHVLAAVSGGADSVALVRALIAAKEKGRGAGRVFVGHVNHQLRGAEADADEAWLRSQREQWGVPFLLRRSETAALAAAQGDGIEAAARVERQRLLAEMAEEVGARYVATAHTRDDQAETVLFRLLRGSGLRGLAGTPRTRAFTASVTLVRPWLGCSRDELRSWLTQLGQTWREDGTNVEVRFARNRVRNELLPYLRAHFNPEVEAAILRTAEQARETQEIIETLATRLLATCGVATADEQITLNVEPMVAEPPLLVAEALRQAWRSASWPEQAMTHRWWRELAALAQDASDGRALNLPGDVLARRAGPQLVLARRDTR